VCNFLVQWVFHIRARESTCSKHSTIGLAPNLFGTCAALSHAKIQINTFTNTTMMSAPAKKANPKYRIHAVELEAKKPSIHVAHLAQRKGAARLKRISKKVKQLAASKKKVPV
jgi:hypothetical protein